MSDPKHPTRADWVMHDPEELPPPQGVELLVLTPGGRCIASPWFEGCLAWSEKPKVPQTVKDRLTANLLAKLKQYDRSSLQN